MVTLRNHKSIAENRWNVEVSAVERRRLHDRLCENIGDKALDRAKAQLKTELQKAIQHDPDLLGRLCAIVDDAKVK